MPVNQPPTNVPFNAATLWTGWDQLSPLLRYGNFWDGEPERGFGPRYIQDFQILLIQSGCGDATINGRFYCISAGDLVFYGPHELHAVRSSSRTPLKLIGLHFLFQQDDLARLDTTLHHVSPLPFAYPRGELHLPLVPRPPAKSSPGIASGAQRVCESLALSYTADPGGRMLEKRGLLLLLFEIWREAILQEALRPSLAPLHRQMIDEAQLAILNNLRNPPGLGTLCKTSRLSERYFARLFKARTGMSMRQFILHHRLLWARRLLIEGRLNVSEVAYTVGFDDPHYFSRCFAHQFGAAPSLVRSERQLA
jgi:AraC-like DNA-binding protein